MANANWQGGRQKTKQAVYAMFRHNDRDRRQETNHSNPHINRSMTPQNWSLYGLTYEERKAKFDSRLDAIDCGRQSSGKNARTILQGVIVYPPPSLHGDLSALRAWYSDVGRIAEDLFGRENVIDMAVDVDEVHTYTDPQTHETRESQEHGHLWLVPETGGKLNAKAACDVRHIKAFNRALDEMTRQKYNTLWNDGTGAKAGGDRSVDALKAASRVAELEARAEQITRETVAKCNQQIQAANDYADRTEAKADRYAEQRKAEADALVTKARSRAQYWGDIERRSQQAVAGYLRPSAAFVALGTALQATAALKGPQTPSEAARAGQVVQEAVTGGEALKMPESAAMRKLMTQASETDARTAEKLRADMAFRRDFI